LNWTGWKLFGTDDIAPYEWSFTAPDSHAIYELYSVAADVLGNVESAPERADASCGVVIPATVDIDPDTLNLKSQGRWITAYIELPAGLNPENIDVGTVAIEGDVFFQGVLYAEPRPTSIGDHDNNGIPDLMVKFDRATVQALVEVGENVELTVVGRWGQAPFRGSDNIRVIDPGRGSGNAQSHGNRPEVPPGQSGGHPGQGQGPPSTPPGHGGELPGQGNQGNGQGSSGGQASDNQSPAGTPQEQGGSQGPSGQDNQAQSGQTPPGQDGQSSGQGDQGNQGGNEGNGQGNSGNQGNGDQGNQNQGQGNSGGNQGNGNQGQGKGKK
jgi:hypothetical protein